MPAVPTDPPNLIVDVRHDEGLPARVDEVVIETLELACEGIEID